MFRVHTRSRASGASSPQARLCSRAVTVALALVLATATAGTPGDPPLSARVDGILERRGLGADALAIIDNIVRHEDPPPFAAPPLVRSLLARPLAAHDAAAIFSGVVPAALWRLGGEAPPAAAGAPPPVLPLELNELVARYVDELSAAQAALRRAAQRDLDSAAILEQLKRGPLGAGALRRIADAVDTAQIERATHAFLEATVRFVDALQAGGPRLRFPATAHRFDTALGIVSIGTPGDDVHGADAALIIDPGGNDRYERAPVTGGRVAVIVDLGGDDQYHGSDLVVHGLAAVIDFSGNDRYRTSGPGLAAAIAGASLLVDFSGNDTYEAGLLGQGAAAFGLGALIDRHGDDTYSLQAGGQGFGMAGGLGLLWDREGADRYEAKGLADAFGRGGGISNAQGAAFGSRTSIAGGIGILRDDAGDDIYEAEMFAQGMGFYYALGILWDRSGNDRYRAVRYAQGSGVHEAVGVLRDEGGNDQYELTVGVGQGMGLDLAVGMLVDAAGDDRYRAPVLAQGAATANGWGILVDGGGADRWHIGTESPSAWGRAHWARGLPSVGLLLHQSASAVFTNDRGAVAPAAHSVDFGGPFGDAPLTHEPPAKTPCPQASPGNGTGMSFSEALNAIVPGLGGGKADAAAYAVVEERLRTALAASFAELPRESFNAVWALSESLRCTLSGAPPAAAAEMWNALEGVLAAEPDTPFAGAIGVALHERPAPPAQMARILRVLDRHRNCGVRALALSLRHASATDDATRAAFVPHAQAALHAPCWRLQATARSRLRRLGIAPEENAASPSFWRTAPGAAAGGAR